MMLEIAAVVHVGMLRQKNDDRILLGHDVHAQGSYNLSVSEGQFFAAVADGVGGENGGDIAATIALEYLSRISGQQIEEQALAESISGANNTILALQAQNPELAKMSTTLSGAFIQGNDLLTFNVGDSRIYRFRDGMMRQLSRDHSEVQSLVDMSMITPEQARVHPDSNIITRYLGHKTRCVPDIVPYQDSFFPNDLLLICSDGLTDMLGGPEIKAVLKLSELSLTEKCSRLASFANAQGGHDNISIILILFKGQTIELS